MCAFCAITTAVAFVCLPSLRSVVASMMGQVSSLLLLQAGPRPPFWVPQVHARPSVRRGGKLSGAGMYFFVVCCALVLVCYSHFDSVFSVVRPSVLRRSFCWAFVPRYWIRRAFSVCRLLYHNFCQLFLSVVIEQHSRCCHCPWNLYCLFFFRPCWRMLCVVWFVAFRAGFVASPVIVA